MQPFAYVNPTTLPDALAQLAPRWGESDVLAGGTDLLSLMKLGLHTPQRVVNIKNIRELEGIRKNVSEAPIPNVRIDSLRNNLRIGALVTMNELAKNADVRALAKSLSEAAAGVPSPQIRHMGTVGGDLCQRPRCWYYRDGFGLLATKDGKPLVPDGENKYHAIFGGGPAYFVSASSLGPALVSLNARIKLASAKGTREVPAALFFVAPKSEAEREIDLHPDEILTEILIPVGQASRPVDLKTATYEVRQKTALDWPLVTASVAVEMRGTTVASARIVMGHVAPTPWDAEEAAKSLTGKPLTPESIEAAAAAAVAGAKPLSQNAYKVRLAKTAVQRALLAARG